MNSQPIKINCGNYPPGEKISPLLLEAIKKINESYSKSNDFTKYKADIATLFNLDTTKSASSRDLLKITTESKFFFAGFLEGEGSLNVSTKKLKTAKFGVIMDPEFSVTQHLNGVSHLYDALCIFNTGRISYKSGSNATLVFKIDNRISLEEKVLPFYETYVIPCLGCFVVGTKTATNQKIKRIKGFKELIQLFKTGGHKDLDIFITKMLPLWDSLRMQKGQKNESFESVEDVVQYIQHFVRADREENQNQNQNQNQNK
jgi:hypothetical protein